MHVSHPFQGYEARVDREALSFLTRVSLSEKLQEIAWYSDIVMRKYGVVIFIHGCFWHGHEDSHLPKTNVEFYAEEDRAQQGA